MLQDGLISSRKMFFKEECSDVIFHKTQIAKTTKKWLENKSVRLMFWPQIKSKPYSEYLVSHQMKN